MADRRQLAVDLFNHVWTLLRKPVRTPDEDDEMLHAAHASRYHWGEVGTAANRARGEWQCSRVYAVLGRAEPALHHARRCLQLCEAHPSELEPFDLPYAHEALARAQAVAGDLEAAERHAEVARSHLDALDDDDRELLVGDLATIRA
jgi:hypothetical protein